jgi:hypothetical protein
MEMEFLYYLRAEKVKQLRKRHKKMN